MENRPKTLVVWTWVVSMLTLVVVTPITFIMGVFASDNATGAGNPISYALIFGPIIYLILAVATQIAYSRGAYRGTRIFAYVTLAVCALSIAFLASMILGLW